MNPAARVSDYATGNWHDGVIVTGSSKLFIEGRQAALVGGLTACHAGDHSVGMIVTGSGKFIVEGRQLARMGDVTNCGLTIITGSGKFLA